VSAVSDSTGSTNPASITGRTESVNTGACADHVSATNARTTIGEDTHGGISRVQDSGSVRLRSRCVAAFR